MTGKQQALFIAIRAAVAAGQDAHQIVHKAYDQSLNLGLYASAVNMLYQTCPRESQITCVFIRALDSGHKEWIVLTCRGGAALNITGYLAEVGLGRFTSDNRLNTTKYAQDIAQSLGRYLYDDDNAIRVYQA